MAKKDDPPKWTSREGVAYSGTKRNWEWLEKKGINVNYGMSGNNTWLRTLCGERGEGSNSCPGGEK